MHRASSTELDMPQSDRERYIRIIYPKAYTVSSYIVDREVDRGGAVPRATVPTRRLQGGHVPPRVSLTGRSGPPLSAARGAQLRKNYHFRKY